FSMLMLVLADNLLQLFVFWEAVGLCSYLLIGHWYERPSACAAATKAFIVNRVGDFGFLLGLFLAWTSFGSLTYLEIFAQAHQSVNATLNLFAPVGGHWDVSVVPLVVLFVDGGAVEKHATSPFPVCVPKPRKAPPPISALIQPAPVATAVFFLVARLAPLYTFSPTAMTVVAITGGLTMVLGATIAL